MTTTEELDLIEEEATATRAIPEVEVWGDEAVIRVNTAETVEERRVRLPLTTWA